jgi:hypothetical protein
MWDGENKRKLIIMHGKENHNQTTGWCSLEYVLYYREEKTISIEKYILIVSSTNPKIGIVRLKIRLTVLCAMC